MKFVQHPSNNGVLGAPEGWDQHRIECGALPVTRVRLDPTGDGPVSLAAPGDHNAMVSFWKPDAQELAALAAGQPVMLWVYGTSHPVVAIGVEHVPGEAPG